MLNVQWRFPEETDSGWPSRWHAGVLHDTLRGGGFMLPHICRGRHPGWARLVKATPIGGWWSLWHNKTASEIGVHPSLLGQDIQPLPTSYFQALNQNAHSFPTLLTYMGSVGEYLFRIWELVDFKEYFAKRTEAYHKYILASLDFIQNFRLNFIPPSLPLYQAFEMLFKLVAVTHRWYFSCAIPHITYSYITFIVISASITTASSFHLTKHKLWDDREFDSFE